MLDSEGLGTSTVEDFLSQLGAEDTKNNRRISSPPPFSPRPSGSSPTLAYHTTTQITTTYVRDLHEIIQQITPGSGSGCLQATFDVQQRRDSVGKELPSFSATLRIGGRQDVDEAWVDEGPHSNKKLAKEAVAKIGLEWLKEYKRGSGQGRRVSQGRRGGGLLVGDGAASVNLVQEAEEEELKGGTWVGELNGYVQKHRLQPPIYTIQSPRFVSAFSCTITIPELNGLPVSSLLPVTDPPAFGSPSTFYRKKSTAKAAAARDAMIYIWSVDPTARRVTPPPQYILPALSSTSVTASRVVDVVIPPELEGASAPQLVSWLCPKLRLCSLEYFFDSPSGVPNLVDALGRVKRVKPRVGVNQFVEIGPVKNIFGKPVAKGKVADLALYWMCRKESVRLGIRIVGLKDEYYQSHEEDEDEGDDDETFTIRESEVIMTDEEEDDTMNLA